MESIGFLNPLDNQCNYLITSNYGNDCKIIMEKNEKLRIIINNLKNISSNDLRKSLLNYFNDLKIKSLVFVLSSLIKPFDMDKIINILSDFPKSISKIKFLGYFERNNNLEKISLPYLNLSTLSIKNLIYPNFNIFELFYNIELETFKLDNYKFSSNEELQQFFLFVKKKKIKNLILNNIFIEIFENNNNSLECEYEYGILKTYFEFNGNSISLILNDDIVSSEIKSLTLNNCKLLYINIDDFSMNEGNIKIICDKKSVLNEESSILFFKFEDNILSITIDGQTNINYKLLNLINTLKINSCGFINFYKNENIFEEIKLNCNSLNFKKCNFSFINEILSNKINTINSLSIKDCFEENEPLNICNILNLFSENKINLTIRDSNFEIPNMNYSKLKLSIYEFEKEDLKNKQNIWNIVFNKEHEEIILEGNVLVIFDEIIINNFDFKSNKITFDNLLLNNEKNDNTNYSIKDKEITLLNMAYLILSNKTINLDYNTFNNILYIKNELSDFEHLINNIYYDEETKNKEKINEIYNDIKIFYNKDFNFCFYVKNHIELRNIILSLFLFFDNKNSPTKEDICDKLGNNFIPTENETIPLLYEYYLSDYQRQFINNLQNLSFKKIKKENRK